MRYSLDENVDKKVRELIARGAVFEHAVRGKHNALRFPNGAKMPVIWKPSDYRAGLNWCSQVKRSLAQGVFDVQQTPSPK